MNECSVPIRKPLFPVCLQMPNFTVVREKPLLVQLNKGGFIGMLSWSSQKCQRQEKQTWKTIVTQLSLCWPENGSDQNILIILEIKNPKLSQCSSLYSRVQFQRGARSEQGMAPRTLQDGIRLQSTYPPRNLLGRRN